MTSQRGGFRVWLYFSLTFPAIQLNAQEDFLQAITLQPAVYAGLQLPGTMSPGNSGDLHNTTKRPQLPPSRQVNIK